MVCTKSSTPTSGETLMGGATISKPKMCGISISTGFTCMGAITSLTFQCKKEGGTVGTLYGRVYNSSTVLKCTLGDMDASTVSTSMTQYTFNSPDTTYTLQDGDKIVFEYGDGTNTGYLIFQKAVGTAVSDSAYTEFNANTSTWSENSSDSAGNWSITTGTTPTTSTTLLPPPPAYVYVVDN